MKLASIAYPVERIGSLAQYEAKLSHWVEDAVGEGAKLLLFPEYASTELAALGGDDWSDDLVGAMEAACTHFTASNEIVQHLAKKHGVGILAPGGLRKEGKHIFNESYLFLPEGTHSVHQKTKLTPFEKSAMGLTPGELGSVVESPWGKLGVLICYDSEFPLLARSLVEQGAELLLIPACTERAAGHHRVHVGAAARALEGQCVVAVSPLIGNAPWNPLIDVNVGAAGVFGPPDVCFPDTGIIATGQLNQAGWLYANFSSRAVKKVRSSGAVRGLADW